MNELWVVVSLHSSFPYTFVHRLQAWTTKNSKKWTPWMYHLFTFNGGFRTTIPRHEQSRPGPFLRHLSTASTPSTRWRISTKLPASRVSIPLNTTSPTTFVPWAERRQRRCRRLGKNGGNSAEKITSNHTIHLQIEVKTPTRSRLRSLRRWKSWRLLNMRRWHLGWLFETKNTRA